MPGARGAVVKETDIVWTLHSWNLAQGSQRYTEHPREDCGKLESTAPKKRQQLYYFS